MIQQAMITKDHLLSCNF